ncbi:MAG: hypothetical protein ACRBBW_19000 [Cellvibrionaceae bacterium]
MSQPQTTASLVNVDNQNSQLMRERLMHDITRLERKLEQLKISDDNRDFSLQQTYREMIHSRREMLTAIPSNREF